MRKYFALLLVIALFFATLISLPRLDYTEADVFFYLSNLPLIYYVTLLASIFVVLFSKQKLTRLVSVCIVALLILWTPSLILLHPWQLDTYPFLAETVYVRDTGHLGDFHYVQENPPLSLTFGSLLQITGMNPLILPVVYSGFLIVITVLFLYLIMDKLRPGSNVAALAPLLFVAILWPNIYHINRQGFSLVYYLMALILLISLVMQKPKRSVFVLLSILTLLMVFSHPATPLFFIGNLILVLVLSKFSRAFPAKEHGIILRILIFTTIAWLVWNTIGTSPQALLSLRELGEKVLKSLLVDPSAISGVGTIFGGRTEVYSLIINARLFLTFLVVSVSFIAPLLLYRRLKDKKILILMVGLSWSSIATAVPLLYGGLPWFYRPILFSYIGWAFIGAFLIEILTEKKNSIMRTKLKKVLLPVFLMFFIIGPAIAMPILKLAPLPFLYPNSQELISKHFLDSYWRGNRLVYLEFSPPYHYSYIVDGHYEARAIEHWGILEDVYEMGEGLNNTELEGTTIWITYRLTTRDAFWTYNPSMMEVVTNVTNSVNLTAHNIVYNSGWPYYILISAEAQTLPSQ